MNGKVSEQEQSEISTRLARLESVVAGYDQLDDGIDLHDLLDTLVKGKWFILLGAALSALVVIAVVLRLPDQYKATAVLMPASSSATSSLTRIAAQFGGLASLAGLSLGGQSENDKTLVAIELIKSWGFQEQFIRDNHLEEEIFATKGWDRLSNRLKIDPAIYDVRQAKWVRKFDPSQGQTAHPGGWELYRKFSGRVSIDQAKKTNLVTLSVEYYSPYIAKDLVDKLIVSVNQHFQEKDQAEAEKSIQYLESKLAQTSLTEMKEVLSRLIEEQTKNLMLARISDEYVLKTLSPAKIPEEKSRPKRSVICVVATLMGGAISAALWLMWSMIRDRNSKRKV